MSQRNQHLSFKYTWNLICTYEKSFSVTDVAVLTILSLNPWISFDAFEIREKGTSA